MGTSQGRATSIDLQERDITFLCGLLESRVMTSKHVSTLYFDAKSEYTKKRLQKIKAAELIGERTRRVNQPSVLFLTRKGYSLLLNGGHLSGIPNLSPNSFEARAKVSELTLRHELEIMDVKAAFHAAIGKADHLSLVEFTTWPLLNQFEASRDGFGASSLVKPDGFIRIHEQKGYLNCYDCFLEVDRSSEVLNTIVGKAVAYLDYYKSGGFAERNGASRLEYKGFPFRVLMILKSAERRNNLAERLVQNTPPILTHTWLTTLADVTTDPLGPIWIQPKGYRDATNGTAFDIERVVSTFVYRKQIEREKFIESAAKKLSLLTG